MLTKKMKWDNWSGFFSRQIRILCFFLFFGVCLLPFSASAFDVFLGTEAPGSFSYFAGRVLCRMINSQKEDIHCQQVPTTDSIYNLTNLKDGSLDISLVDSRTLFNAINKTGKFEFLDIDYKGLQVLAPLYDLPVTLIVRKDAGIASLNDLKGKRINAGTPQSPQYLAVGSILKAKQWSKKDFSLFGDLPPSQSRDDEKAFCYGTMQAMVYIGIHPDFSLRHLLENCNASLLNLNDKDINKLTDADPALWQTEIATGTYPSCPEKIMTFGTRVMLVVSADFDQETVYNIIKLIDNNKQYLENIHPAFSLFSPEIARNSSRGITLHPGAVKYLTEHQ